MVHGEAAGAASLAKIAELLTGLSREVEALVVSMRQPAPARRATVEPRPTEARDLTAMLTTDDLRTALNVSTNTVYALISSGELPATKVGRDYRFWRSDVEKLLERNRVARN